MKSFSASPPPLLQMGQCPCLPSVHLFRVWMVGSVCSWQNPGTDLCPPLLTCLQDPGQGSGALSGIYRKIWPGRENKYSPDFIFSAHKPARGTGQAPCGAGPASEGMGFIHPMTNLHRAPWTKGWGVTESYYRDSLFPDKIDHFLTEEWLLWYYCFGQDVRGLRILSMCNLYTSHLSQATC